MDRSFNEIQRTILDAITQANTLNSLQVLTSSEQTMVSANSSSKVAIWRLWVWVFSFAIWLLEKTVSKNAENSRPHTIRWYIEQCLNFHDGFELVWLDGQFQYNDTVTEASKIIDRVAVLESNDGELVVKVATDNNGTIEPLTPAQLTRFENYLNLIKDAGNRLRIINQPADLLRMTLNVYVDVSIIDLETGKLLNVEGDVYPVKEAIDAYLANLEFNGGFVKEFFKNKIQEATGIKLPLIESIEWKYASFDWATFGEWKVPEAGYFKIEPTDLNINYLNYALANN